MNRRSSQALVKILAACLYCTLRTTQKLGQKPTEITQDVKLSDWTWYATGPGAGIQLKKGEHQGRLVIPCDHKVIVNGKESFRSHVICSDDSGTSWKLGGVAPEDAVNECEVADAIGWSNNAQHAKLQTRCSRSTSRS